MIDRTEFLEMSRELNRMEAETAAGNAQSNRYKKNVAEMMRDNKDEIGSFQTMRFPIKKSLWSRIMDWLDRLINII